MDMTYEIVEVYPNGEQESHGLMIGYKEAFARLLHYRRSYPYDGEVNGLFYMLPYRPDLDYPDDD